MVNSSSEMILVVLGGWVSVEEAVVEWRLEGGVALESTLGIHRPQAGRNQNYFEFVS